MAVSSYEILRDEPAVKFEKVHNDEKLISPKKLAAVKLKTNKMEKKACRCDSRDLSRPVNLDPGYIEPSKLVLASTKNFSHRIYIGKKNLAEVTLVYNKGKWTFFEYTFPPTTGKSGITAFSAR